MALDAQLLNDSLELVSGGESLVTLRFYEILFERYPQLQPLFGRARNEQAKMLQESIVAVVDHVDQPAWLAEHLHALGARHVDYGVTADMYPLVAECLIATLAEQAGDAWTPQMDAAWAEALTAIATLMIQGQEAAVAG